MGKNAFCAVFVTDEIMALVIQPNPHLTYFNIHSVMNMYTKLLNLLENLQLSYYKAIPAVEWMHKDFFLIIF